AGGTAAESPSISERQLIKEVGIELVLLVVRPNSPVEPQIEPIQNRPGLILVAAGKVGGIDIHYFRKGITGFERQPGVGTPRERDAPSVVAAGAQIHPG